MDKLSEFKIEELKEKIKFILTNIQFLEKIKSYIDNILNLYSELNPNSVNMFETLKTSQLDFGNIYLNIAKMGYKDINLVIETNWEDIILNIKNLLEPLNVLFFYNKNLSTKNNIEKRIVSDLYFILYGNHEEIGFLESLNDVNKNKNLSNHELKQLYSSIKSILNYLSKLLNLKTNESFSSNEISIKREIDIIEDFLFYVNMTKENIHKKILINEIKNFFYKIHKKITQAIKNDFIIKEHEMMLREILLAFERNLEINNIKIEDILKLGNIIYSEITHLNSQIKNNEKLIKKLIVSIEKDLEKESKHNNLAHNINKNADSYSWKIQDLLKIIESARDPKTAIKHLKKGPELQLHFSKDDVNDNELKQIEAKIQLEQKKLKDSELEKSVNIQSWFKYGDKDSDKNETKNVNLKKTNFGTSLDKLLKENGIDPALVNNSYNKKKK